MLRKFGIFVTRSLIIIIIASLIFSFISFDLQKILPGLFGDVFAYASQDSQKEVISKLASTCSAMQHGEKVISINQICSNATLLAALNQNCKNYRELKAHGKKVENEAKMEESCKDIESGEIEKTCSQQKSPILPDFDKIGILCSEHSSGKINDLELFSGVLSSPFSETEFEKSENPVLKKYQEFTDFANNNKMWSYFILVTLLGVLYLLIWNFEEYILVVMGICFSIGLIIMLPYAAVYLYDKFVGIDTTSILNILFGNGSLNPKSVISVIMLLFLRTYNTSIIIIGIILLGIGIGGKGIKIMSPASKKEHEKKD